MVDVRLGMSDGSAARVTGTPSVLPRVAAGYYVSGNANPGPDLAGIRWTGQTVYRSISEPGTSQYPGPAWVSLFVNGGGWLNLVLELKSYASGNGPIAAQAIVVEGRSYNVPATAGTIQRGRSTPPSSYSYQQVIDGKVDGLLHRSLTALRQIPINRRVNVQLASEVDTDNEFGTTQVAGGPVVSWAESDALAVRAYDRMISWFRDPPTGVAPCPANVTFSLGFAGSWSGALAFSRTHPDLLPVDYCMWNCYNRSSNKAPEDRLRETAAYRSALGIGPRMRSLPVIVAEFGSNAAWPGGQAAYLERWPAAVNTVNAELVRRGEGPYVMTNWFGSDTTEWGRVPDADKPAFFAAMRRAYSTSPFLVGA